MRDFATKETVSEPLSLICLRIGTGFMIARASSALHVRATSRAFVPNPTRLLNLPADSVIFAGTIGRLMSLTDDSAGSSVSLDFESLVASYYCALYKFAFSLTQAEAEACDLTQQTFYIWATKGHQLRDVSKVKTWLFTTLHREFLESRRRQTRFPHHELSQVASELPVISPARVNQLDSGMVLQALAQVDEVYQAPVALFYLEDCSYKEIAEILEVPLGTVKSRIARGIAQLQKQLAPSDPPDRAHKGFHE
jgi:RNA polymerase sigma factor (sigma-70 family)